MHHKTVIFDFDSTLVTIEGINELAKMNQVDEEVSALTSAAMDGTAPFESVFQERLNLIRPTAQQLKQLGHMYRQNITPGALKLIRYLKLKNIQVHVITGGYLQAIRPTIELFQIPASHVHAVVLDKDPQGFYTRIKSNYLLTYTHGKRDLLIKLNPHRKVVFVGDGSTDLMAKPAVDLFIGFGGVEARDTVRRQAHHYLEEPNLEAVLRYIK